MIFQLRPALRHIASMAGDSETHPRSGDENTDIIRQPFLIGVSGGTASGKVCVLSCYFGDFLHLSKLDFVSALTVNRRGGSAGCWSTAWLQRRSVIDSSFICLTIHLLGRARKTWRLVRRTCYSCFYVYLIAPCPFMVG